MCILSYLPPESPTDLDGLANGAISNEDGHGWAIAFDGKIIWSRSLNADEALTTFEAARKRYRGPAIFHSRWMTHGKISIANTHPFMAGEAELIHAPSEHEPNRRVWVPTGRLTPLTVVAHNGIFGKKEAIPGPDDPRSDTRIFAEDILPTRFRKLDKRSVQRELATWAGSNKVAILTVDPRLQASAYIVNKHLGETDHETGIWHSNADYRKPFGRWQTHTFPKKSDSSTANVTKSAEESAEVFEGVTDDDWRCDMCGMGVVNGDGYCDVCASCKWCTETLRDCECRERVYAAMALAEKARS